MRWKPYEERFWEKTNRPSNEECWEWEGVLANGYGYIWCEGEHMRAHRLSWVIHFGSIPLGKLVLHKCDNKGCVNPNHLYLGTQSDNMMDIAARHPSRGRRSRFYEGEVWLMKRLRENGTKDAVIAKVLKVSRPYASELASGYYTPDFRDGTNNRL